MPTPFQRAAAKLSIASLDSTDLFVDAQYNPKELELSHTVGWADHKSTTGQSTGLVSEFGGANPQTTQIELLFDGFETEGMAGRFKVAKHIERLKQMTAVIDPTSKDPEKRRPHYCVVVWGNGGLPKLRCVIESMKTKYTMFSAEGEVLRATVTISVKEINIEAVARDRMERDQLTTYSERRKDRDEEDLQVVKARLARESSRRA